MPTAHDVIGILNGSSCETSSSDLVKLSLPSLDLGVGHLFGGQVFAQACLAASCWLESYASKLYLHSFHGVFLKAGTAFHDLTYTVSPLGLGRTFQRLDVVAFQQGKLVFKGFASAQRIEPAFLVHQLPMPKVPLPHDLMSLCDIKQKRFGASAQTDELPIEVRVATPEVFLSAAGIGASQGFWFRFKLDTDNCDAAPQLRENQCQCLLAFASDYGFLGTVFVSYDPSIKIKPFFMTSLDHTLWYYFNYKPFEWTYFESESPVAQGGRGLVTGRFYQCDRLIAVATQEGLLRHRN